VVPALFILNCVMLEISLPVVIIRYESLDFSGYCYVNMLEIFDCIVYEALYIIYYV